MEEPHLGHRIVFQVPYKSIGLGILKGYPYSTNKIAQNKCGVRGGRSLYTVSSSLENGPEK